VALHLDAQNWSWSGRYDGFDEGHAMKGAYRRSSWWELGGTVSRHANGQALAIVPPAALVDPNAPKRVLLENTVIYDDPGGHEPRCGLTSEIVAPSER